jgi:class 3 adenylate cyclase
MNCPSCAQDNPDRAKFCLECGQPIARMCGHCATELPADAKFCLECGTPTSQSAPASASLQSPKTRTERAPSDYTPKHLAEKILQSKSALEGERKQVTVLFADVKGSMDLAAQFDPEEWHRILERFFEILTEGVHRFEGTVNQYTGDGIMALFGAPIAHEDHAQRACYAALHLKKELQSWARELKREHGLGFPTRLGIHSGEVVVGKIGDDLRMDYTAQGHAVGLAQRMEALAEANTCYLSQATAKLVAGYFEIENLGEFSVKGAPEAMEVFELLGFGDIQTRLGISTARGLSQFVGREADMQSLDSALEQAQSGNGQVVGIVAEAGTGKSRLCFEFLERCRAKGMKVLEGHAVAHGKKIPLLPILQVFRSYFGIGEADDDRTIREKIAGRLLLLDSSFADFLPVQFEFFGVPDPDRPVPPMDPEAKQRQIFSVMRRVIQGAEQEIDQMIVLVEDLHWMDSVSEAFLEQLVEAVSESSFLLLVNFRPDYSAGWTSKSYYRQIPLAPLGPDDVRSLLDDLLGYDASTVGLAESIHERTGGNPFFTEEVVQNLIESKQLEGSKGAYRLVTPIAKLEVPSTVQALLAARIDRLGEHEKLVLQSAAVIGKEFPESILVAVSEESTDEVHAALRTLKEAEFIYEQAIYPVVEYAFKHPLTQEVALGSQLRERRRRTHAAVAKAIEEASVDRLEQSAALLAHHWEQAGDGPTAARFHAMAAAASGLSDLGASLDHWRRTVALAGEGQAELVVAASSQVLSLGWRKGASEEECEKIFDHARVVAERAGAFSSLASLTANYGGYRGISLCKTFDYVRYALDSARIADETGDLELRCGTRGYVIYAYIHAGLVEPGLAACDELEELLDGDPHRGAEVTGFSPLVGVAHVRACFKTFRGDSIDSRAAFGAARQAALDHGYPEMVVWIRNLQTLVARILGDTSEAAAWARESLDIAEDKGSLSDRMSNLSLARSLGYEGNAEAQLEVAHECLRKVRETRDARCCEVDALAIMADAYLALGDRDDSLDTADEATRLIMERGTYGYGFTAFGTLVEARLAFDAAASEVESALDRYASALDHTGNHLFARELEGFRAQLAERTP